MPSFIPQTSTVSLLKVPLTTFWTGVYLVQAEGLNILVDSSTESERVDTVIVPALSERGLTPRDIDVLMCTHTHGDHIGGHKRLVELGVKKVAVALCSEDKIRNPLVYNKRIRAVFPEDSAPPAAVLDGVDPDIFLCNGAAIGPVSVHFTPGHDDDCVVIRERNTNALLTGDSLQWHGTDVQGCALVMYLHDYLQSLDKCLALKPSYIIPGHDFNPYTDIPIDTPEKCLKAIKDASGIIDHYETIIREQLASGICDPHDIARHLITVTDGTIPHYLFLPLYTVTQILQRIEGK